MNRCIITSGAFEAVIDFDKVMPDSCHLSRLRLDLQSGDWLHPNAVGYRLMGDTVVLPTLR